MAARKLQTEIERTLKKVAEGVEIFEGIFEKIQTSTNQTQKEKLEVDLKSQIKKLQRLRDQIKTWMQSNDIKDKQPLLDNRKLIETQMERFKACEKEMKTKAFSKEGLSAAAKLDPKEQQKLELCQWTTTMVDELSRQVEQAEAEIETLQLLKKKKDSDREQRLDQLETLNERRAWHINRLELILRLLENGNLQTEAVADIKDDIAYFVESNTEEDFEEDEGIYDELNLEEEEDMYQVGGDDFQSSHDSTSVADEVPIPASIPTPAPPKTPAKEKAPKKEEESPVKKSTIAARKSTLDSTTPRPTNLITTPARSVSGPQPTPTKSAAPPMPTIRYAAAAAANLPPTPTLASAAAPSSTSTASASAPAPAAAAPPPGLTQSPLSTPSSEAPPALSSAEASRSATAEVPLPSPLAAPGGAPGLGQPSPAMSSASIPNSNGPSASSAPSVSSQSPAAAAASPAPSSASLPQPPADATASAESKGEGEAKSAEQQQQQAPKANEPRLPSSLSDLVTSFESAKQKSMNRDNDLGAIHQILDAGFSNVPQPLDAEKPKYYVPRQPFATPGYYPQEPSGQFANPALFAKLDVDTLFYIFYYCQGTYLQYLAASELKKQSWRFHKQYLTWFQRANEPQQITDEYEQGVYLYFDWEGSWCQRRKNDFKFSYKFLDSD